METIMFRCLHLPKCSLWLMIYCTWNFTTFNNLLCSYILEFNYNFLKPFGIAYCTGYSCTLVPMDREMASFYIIHWDEGSSDVWSDIEVNRISRQILQRGNDRNIRVSGGDSSSCLRHVRLAHHRAKMTLWFTCWRWLLLAITTAVEKAIHKRSTLSH